MHQRKMIMGQHYPSKSDLIDILLDCRICLIWLRIIEEEKYREDITKVIKRIELLVEEEQKDS